MFSLSFLYLWCCYLPCDIFFDVKGSVVILSIPTGRQRTGIHSGVIGFRGNRCHIWGSFWRSLYFYIDHPSGLSIDLQLCWCTDKDWSWRTRVSLVTEVFRFASLWKLDDYFTPGHSQTLILSTVCLQINLRKTEILERLVRKWNRKGAVHSILYNKLGYVRILIGSHLWSIGGQTYRWRYH